MQNTVFDPEDGCSMYLRNAYSIFKIHTPQRFESRTKAEIKHSHLTFQNSVLAMNICNNWIVFTRLQGSNRILRYAWSISLIPRVPFCPDSTRNMFFVIIRAQLLCKEGRKKYTLRPSAKILRETGKSRLRLRAFLVWSRVFQSAWSCLWPRSFCARILAVQINWQQAHCELHGNTGSFTPSYLLLFLTYLFSYSVGVFPILLRRA